MTEGSTRWDQIAGGGGADYAARIDALADSGADMHGEATFCEGLLRPPDSVLDAGCGTGRVAIELSRRGYRVTGIDLDESMLGVARARGPDVTWIEEDVSRFELDTRFDLIVCAGNVIPLLADGTGAKAVRQFAKHLRPAGVLVCGFGLDLDHLPLDDVPVDIATYDGWCVEAGLDLADRWATWDRQPWDHGGYAVSVHVS